jgi:uncharacterized protein YcaQ
MKSISRDKARRALSHVHGLDCQLQGKKGTLAVMVKHKCIQSDPIDVAGRNHDLTLQSRVEDYKPKYLDDLLYKDRKLFEYTCKMLSIMPIEAYPIFHWRRQFHVAQDAAFMKEHRHTVKEILKAAENGPVASRHFESEKKEHWWGMTKVARIALERLWMQGVLVIHHRERGIKFYALAEDVIPAKILSAEPPSETESLLAKTLIIVKASRLVSPTRAPEQWCFAGRKSSVVSANLEKLVKSGDIFRLTVEGCKGNLYAPIEDRDTWDNSPGTEENQVRFLAPLDPLIWNRKLFCEVYDHAYKWEVYTRPHERKHGYYCLPVFFNGDYVGLIEPYFRKKDRVLELRSFHVLHKDLKKNEFLQPLEEEIGRFASNLGAVDIEADDGCPKFMSKIASGYSGSHD